MPWQLLRKPMLEVIITQAPPGEAPLWVREAWIGLRLPTDHERPTNFLGFGVLSGPRGIAKSIVRTVLGEAAKVEGYGVLVLDAIKILQSSRPDAADWWRTNASYMMKRGRRFVFDADACRLAPR